MNQSNVSLKALQSWMQAALIDPGSIGLQGPQELDVTSLINPSSRMSADERLLIYRRGYNARLLECLSAQYSVLKRALGAELFDDFCSEYLAKYPSESYTLGQLGERFPKFLRETKPPSDETQTGWQDFLIEVAEFEWGIYSLFDAITDTRLPHAKEGTDERRLVLTKDLRMFGFNFPVHLYYKAVKTGGDTAIPSPRPSYLALVRKNFGLGVFELRERQYGFLTQLYKGASVTAAIHHTSRQTDLGAPLVKALWHRWAKDWIRQGLFQVAD